MVPGPVSVSLGSRHRVALARPDSREKGRRFQRRPLHRVRYISRWSWPEVRTAMLRRASFLDDDSPPGSSRASSRSTGRQGGVEAMVAIEEGEVELASSVETRSASWLGSSRTHLASALRVSPASPSGFPPYSFSVGLWPRSAFRSSPTRKSRPNRVPAGQPEAKPTSSVRVASSRPLGAQPLALVPFTPRRFSSRRSPSRLDPAVS